MAMKLAGNVVERRYRPISVLLLVTVACTSARTRQPVGDGKDTSDMHGGVPMGVIDNQCDNGTDYLSLDWDSSPEDYTCTGVPNYGSRKLVGRLQEPPQCTDHIAQPLHVCMFSPIEYDDPIPTSGAHRPLWARYGEYLYLPRQRWLHNLEHGAAVFLYHPCADPVEVELLRRVATSCLRKHIITPLKELSRETPFAVLTYGCKFLLPSVNVGEIVQFVRTHALHAPESLVVQDGQYDSGLVVPAGIVSDERDSNLCPAEMIQQVFQPEQWIKPWLLHRE